MDIIDKIRIRHGLSLLPSNYVPPKHQPEMLYIGCVDARLDPIDDIGIPKGTALIFRNIGALVFKDDCCNDRLDREAILANREVPQNASIGAVLEFFLHHIPIENDKMKHIVVSGHTDCGGLKACQFGEAGKGGHYLPLYLDSLREVRAEVMSEARAKGWSDEQTLQALEKESVRHSIANLKSYPMVRKAIDEGKLQVHGWVIDTATQCISEMNPKTLEFEQMARKQ